MEDDERLPTLLSTLTSQLLDLSDTLQPLLTSPVSQTASTLPILDAAKLNVLAAYSLHTLIFNTLKLNGIDAHAHSVYQELARVRTYFRRVAEAEEKGAGNASQSELIEGSKYKLDKEAVGRFVRHGLTGNTPRQQKRFGDDDLDAEAIQRRVDERQAAEAQRQYYSGKKQTTRHAIDRPEPGSSKQHTKLEPPKRQHEKEYLGTRGLEVLDSHPRIPCEHNEQGYKRRKIKQSNGGEDRSRFDDDAPQEGVSDATAQGTSTSSSALSGRPSKSSERVRHDGKRNIANCKACHREGLAGDSCPHKGPRADADVLKDLVERGSKAGAQSNVHGDRSDSQRYRKTKQKKNRSDHDHGDS